MSLSIQDETAVEKGKSSLKKPTKPTDDVVQVDVEKGTDKDKEKKKDEEERNDYTIKKTTKGGEFYDNFMQQVCFVRNLHTVFNKFLQIDEHIMKRFPSFVKVIVTSVPKNNVVFRILINIVEKYF